MQGKIFYMRKKASFICVFGFLIFLILLVTLFSGCTILREREEARTSKFEKIPKPPSQEILLQKSLEVINKWYKFSDENSREGLKGLLSSHWKEKKNQERLEELLNDWTFTEEELKKGYRGLTREKKVISQRVVKSSYGEIAIVELRVNFEVWDEAGHRFLKGINTFGLIWNYEKGKWQPRIRTIEWRETKR
jgi:hypothetical protein